MRTRGGARERGESRRATLPPQAAAARPGPAPDPRTDRSTCGECLRGREPERLWVAAPRIICTPRHGPGKSLRGVGGRSPSALPRSSEPSGLLPWGSGSDLSCYFLFLVVLGRRKKPLKLASLTKRTVYLFSIYWAPLVGQTLLSKP